VQSSYIKIARRNLCTNVYGIYSCVCCDNGTLLTKKCAARNAIRTPIITHTKRSTVRYQRYDAL